MKSRKTTEHVPLSEAMNAIEYHHVQQALWIAKASNLLQMVKMSELGNVDMEKLRNLCEEHASNMP